VQASRENRDSPVLSENKLSYEEMIRMGLNHLERGNWDHAASSFAEVLNLYPDEVNALFYQSMANLKQGKMEEAKRGFERVLAHPVSTFAEDAQFFRAASLKGLGRITEAEYAWREVAECGGYYAERALVELSHLEFRDSTGMESP
jgi:tetratricopeptide (TPR) repeat protein